MSFITDMGSSEENFHETLLQTSQEDIPRQKSEKNKDNIDIIQCKKPSDQKTTLPIFKYNDESKTLYFDDPVKSFEFFMNDHLVNYIIKRINKKIKKSNDKKNCIPYVYDKDEIRKFLAILMYNAVISPKNLAKIWDKSSLQHNRIIARTITYHKILATLYKIYFFL